MKKISKILFPTDFSETAINAFRYALWFADRCQATLDVWHFVTPEFEPIDFPVVSGELTHQKSEAAKVVMDSFVKTGLRNVQEDHEMSGIPEINTHVEIEASPKNLAEKADESGMDLIIMGTQGKHNTLEKFMGSVSSATIRKSACPVLVIPPGTDVDKMHNVAYATKLSEGDSYYIWSLTKLLSAWNPNIKVVNILEESFDREPISIDDISEFFKDVNTTGEITFHSMIGEDHSELLERFTENNDIDLLVMYRPERNWFERIFHKSLTKEVVLDLKIPLLILK